MRHLIIGLGCGRCGTQSLAKLLWSQDSVGATHESGTPFPWNGTAWLVGHRLSHIMVDAEEHDIGADVAYWYLPHVRYIHTFTEGKTRFICLRREREACIASLIKRSSLLRVNPFQTHNSIGCHRSIWDVSLPKFDFCTPAEAVTRYYDGYYGVAEQFQAEWPDRFRIFDMEQLNTKTGVRAILKFAGVKKPKVITGIKLNTLGDMLDKVKA